MNWEVGRRGWSLFGPSGILAQWHSCIDDHLPRTSSCMQSAICPFHPHSTFFFQFQFCTVVRCGSSSVPGASLTIHPSCLLLTTIKAAKPGNMTLRRGLPSNGPRSSNCDPHSHRIGAKLGCSQSLCIADRAAYVGSIPKGRIGGVLNTCFPEQLCLMEEWRNTNR